MVLRLHVNVPPGYALNSSFPVRYRVEALRPRGLVDRNALGRVCKLTPPKRRLDIVLPVESERGEDCLRLSLAYSICRSFPTGVAKLRGVVWHIPLRVSPPVSRDHVLLETPAD